MAIVSLIIATYNGTRKITTTLESLTKQRLERSLWEVIVVNNNSSDNTAEVVETFAAAHPEIALKLVFEPNQGLSHARNRGIDEASGDYLVIIDDDEIASPDLLAEYYEFLDTHPYVVAAGGRITPHYPNGRPRHLCSFTERPIAGTLDLGKEICLFPDGKYFGGGNMALRRSAIEYYGKFDTNLGRRGNRLLGGEEKELYNRFYSSGENIYYLPKAEILHVIGEEKLTKEYFAALCYRIGQSERIRTLTIGHKEYSRRMRAEFVKWCGALAIATFYTLTLRPSKGYYLLLMRRQITRGLRDSNIDKDL